MAEKQQHSDPNPEPLPLIFDPTTDTVYHLGLGVAKQITWTKPDGRVLLTKDNRPARLIHFWNATAPVMVSKGHSDPKWTIGEAISLLTEKTYQVLGPGESPSEDPEDKIADFKDFPAFYFAIGVGLFLGKNDIKAKVEVRQMTEVELIEMKKKFGREDS